MLESLNDYISLFVMVIGVIIGLIILFIVFNQNHANTIRRKEEEYYSFFDEMNEEFKDTDQDDSYFE